MSVAVIFWIVFAIILLALNYWFAVVMELFFDRSYGWLVFIPYYVIAKLVIGIFTINNRQGRPPGVGRLL
jgi:hypothetical protein